ncbi:Solute carrier organic anion transporter family member 6A1 [Microtus ochrogaster]|uniref:Solute carrier organic anion transporter family member 6A1 n=1 Tax=Microtus ochrogaster TaxID=79684 RepID=A0A8J6GFI4_MICOH|nr:Solute carrier organic anion transporter family member 6A1 [Microtus ochrogaster]
MTEAPKKEQDIVEVAPAQEEDGKDNKEIQNFSKLIPYLRTVPRSVAKFKKLAAEKRLAFSRPLKISDPKYIASLEGPFGFGPLVCPAFQRFNNIDFFLFLYCLTVMVHGALFTLSDMSLKQMVKKFSLTEKEITIMDLTDYYASFLVAIVAAYYGGKGNRSKWLAASAFILGISSIVFAVPFYKYEIIKPLEESEGANKLVLEKEKEPCSFDKRLKDKEFGFGFKDLLQATKCLVCNPLLLCCSLYKTMEFVNFRGTNQFVNLYLENQFLLTPSAATKLTVSVPIPPLFKKTSTEACIYWSINKCGYRGRCWIYNKSKMTYMMMGLCK